MSLVSIKKAPEKCLWACLLIETVYQSYRYPFQINSSLTSPTYRDTPFVLQLTKFLIALVFLFFASGYLFRRGLPFRKWCFAGIVLATCMYPFLRGLLAASQNATYMEVGFWPLAAMILVIASNTVKVSSLNRYFKFIFVYGTVSTIIMVGLLLTIGRLPALAYPHSLSVRFGGFLDDPNGFPALVYMLMGWAWFRYSGTKCFLVETLLVVLVMLSQSFTALGFLILLAFLFAASYLLLRRPVILVTVCVSLGTAVAIFWETLVEFVDAAIKLRQGSIDSHVSQISDATVTRSFDWITGTPNYSPTESWWVGQALNMGLPWVLLNLLMLAVLAGSVFKAFRNTRSLQHKAILGGVGILFFFLMFGGINLPFFKIFPVNFIFYILTFLVFFDRIEDDTPLAQRTAVPLEFEPAGALP